MNAYVIGISGSPIKDSNTDRLIRAVLDNTGLEAEFIKLSAHTVRPCIGCLGCVGDNICKVNDDFPAIAEKIKRAEALVIGGYPPYGSLDAFTKAFLERLFSMRHQKALNHGKKVVTVVTGNGRGAAGIDAACSQLQQALHHEGMEILGQLKVTGNVKCTFCGCIETCPMSALPRLFDGDLNAVPRQYCRVEDQTETWRAAERLGQEIGKRLRPSEHGISVRQPSLDI